MTNTSRFMLLISAVGLLAGCPATAPLPPLQVQLQDRGYDRNSAQQLATASDPTYVHVVFDGLVTHVTGGGFPKRAVVIFDPAHPAALVLVQQNEEAIRAAFKGMNVECAEERCVVTLDRVSLRVVDRYGNEAVNELNTSHGGFKTLVPRLTFPTLHSDVAAEVPPNVPEKERRIAAFFELNRGTFFKTRNSICRGKFAGEPDSAYRDFAKSATLTLAFTNSAVLQAKTKDSNGWKSVPLEGSNVMIEINNQPENSTGESHYHLFNKLKKDSSHDDLPAIDLAGDCDKGGITPEEAEDICFAPDEVPGCGNSSWP